MPKGHLLFLLWAQQKCRFSSAKKTKKSGSSPTLRNAPHILVTRRIGMYFSNERIKDRSSFFPFIHLWAFAGRPPSVLWRRIFLHLFSQPSFFYQGRYQEGSAIDWFHEICIIDVSKLVPGFEFLSHEENGAKYG